MNNKIQDETSETYSFFLTLIFIFIFPLLSIRLSLIDSTADKRTLPFKIKVKEIERKDSNESFFGKRYFFILSGREKVYVNEKEYNSFSEGDSIVIENGIVKPPN